MIVKHLDQVVGTDADVDTEGWTSRRLILKDGGMGYSVHDTIIKAGAELDMHYKNHLETVYLTEGAGEIVDLATGETHQLSVGSIYALNNHDHHLLKANKGAHMRMVCVFNPPITGNEVHDETGAYALCD
ncbi:L-ectoine synthase [Hydrogenophaga crassostreae]|uniref:L-ectoine synthase n=1 Tax=Hydrogenophaga crassostreae TaxID=1763535 RepID=A0A167I4I3_9BURK|nr:ectoine synthase [Hydrogenophaga crassostreae]AOW14138.1 L-ectoine synthase [Hydrogenophaga crassostreae]OAD42139.1 L-ectoine synthase [Hydrogenophaga crassostreae]